MFGLFKNKETPEVKSNTWYYVHIDDVKTVAQLRESVKILMKVLSHQNQTHFHISENKISEYPNLAKIATKGDKTNA